MADKFNLQGYLKKNALLNENLGASMGEDQESLKEATDNELSSYLKAAAEKCFVKGGNGQNLLDCLSEAAAFIGAYMTTSARMSPEEPGFYTDKTAVAFKNLVNAMVQDEITNNHVSKYGAGGDMDDDGDYDNFIKSVNR
jgi:hypothetical protein